MTRTFFTHEFILNHLCEFCREWSSGSLLNFKCYNCIEDARIQVLNSVSHGLRKCEQRFCVVLALRERGIIISIMAAWYHHFNATFSIDAIVIHMDAVVWINVFALCSHLSGRVQEPFYVTDGVLSKVDDPGITFILLWDGLGRRVFFRFRSAEINIFQRFLF